MIKDLMVLGPVLFAGVFTMAGMAQSSERPEGPDPGYFFFLAFLALALLVWYRSKLGSAERLRKLEIERERPAPPPPPAVPVADVRDSAISTLIGAPVGVAGVAWLTCLTTQCDPNFVWSIVGLLGVTSIGCGTLLVARRPAPSPPLETLRTAAPAPAPGFKMAYDPDAYDVVGRRG